MRRDVRSWLSGLLSLLLAFQAVLAAGSARPLAEQKAASGLTKANAKQRKLAPDLEEKLDRAAAQGVTQADASYPVVIQPDDLAAPSAIENKLSRANGRIRDRHESLNLIVAELPLTRLRELVDDDIAYVTPDREVRILGHLGNATGVTQMRGQSGNSGINGKDVNIAVLDSGVWASHHQIDDRLLTSVDFTGQGLTKADPFGHGTHVASLAVGTNHVAHGSYEGVASGAKVANLRVLDSEGKGKVSWVLSALNWVKANAAKNKIRVVNMSLGLPAIDSYKNDPLCKAVRSLVDSGLVVVVAAGNDGKDANGNKVYGRILSPGNEPSAITVGAANDFGTDSRPDDGVATYSSRGPTRSYWADASGVKHYDNLIKPDLVATGNRLLAAMAENNLLLRQNPGLNGRISKDANHNQMYLSGTSMATPVVAGAVSLILQANPGLTPSLVKAILMYTAQPLQGYNMFEQGAGQLNIEGAIRLARVIRTNLSATTSVGAPLLVTSAPPAPKTTLDGFTFNWAQGLILNHTYATGADLITKYQAVYGKGVILSDGVTLSDGVALADAAKMTRGSLSGTAS